MNRTRSIAWVLLALTGTALSAVDAGRPGAAGVATSKLADELERSRMPRARTADRVNPGADRCDSAVSMGTIPPDSSEPGLYLDPMDHEWRSFRLDSPRLIRIETIGDPVDSDTNLTLYRACVNGVPSQALAYNEDRGLADYTSRIPREGSVCLRGATYYVDVGSYAELGTLAPFDLLIADAGSCELPGSDRYEPDDTGATAKPLPIRGASVGGLGPQARTIDPEGDLDFATFRLLEPTVIRLRAGSAQNVNTVIGIADPVKNIYVAINDDAAPGTLGSQIETCLPAGTWIAAAVARAFPDVFHYRLAADSIGPCAFETEPNDSLARAQALPVRSGRATIHGRHDSTLTARDSDYFRFRLFSRRGVVLETSGYDMFDVDTTLDLFDERGRIVVSNDDGGEGFLSRIEMNLDSGTYFARVSGSPFELPDGDAWIYSLRLQLAEPFLEESEPNDECAQASATHPGTRVLAAVQPVGDVDRFQFQVGGSATGGVLLDVAVGSLGDPILRLFDDPPSCFSWIGCDDDTGPGLDPRLTCCVPASAPYSVEVRDFQDNHAIPFYSLEIRVVGECIPTGACPVAANQLGCP